MVGAGNACLRREVARPHHAALRACKEGKS